MNPVWILGPCALESEPIYFEAGSKLTEMMKHRTWFFKASFDKANRTSIKGERGLGLNESLKVFANFRNAFPEVKLTTDVHECYQIEMLVPYIDCIQIPAFLSRQTDLICEAARAFKVINIKKGQWLSPESIARGVDKIKSINQNIEVWLTERGSQFGYDKLLIDFSTVEYYKKHFDKIFLDCTHSTQFISKEGFTMGDRALAENYMMASQVFGYDGVFAEIHPDPNHAISDSFCQIELDRLPYLLEKFDNIKAVIEKC